MDTSGESNNNKPSEKTPTAEQLLSDRKQLAELLNKQPPPLTAALVVRVALRILPALANGKTFYFWESEKRATHASAVWKKLERGYIFSTSGRAAADVPTDVPFNTASDAALAAIKATDAASYAAYGASDTDFVAVITAYATSDAAAAVNAIKRSILVDIEWLQQHSGKESSGKSLLLQPLWASDQLPEKWPEYESNLQNILQELGLELLWDQYLGWLEGRATLPSASHQTIDSSFVHQEGPPLQDQLNRQPVADSIAALLDHPQQSEHFTIALLGRWGEGKSAVLDFLKQALERLSEEVPGYQPPKHRFIWSEFDAWGHEHSEQLPAALAQRIVADLKAKLSWGQQLSVLRTLRWRSRLFDGMRMLFATLAATVLVVLGLAYLADVALPTGKVVPSVAKEFSLWDGLLESLGLGFLVVFVGFLWLRWDKVGKHPFIQGVQRALRLPDYGEHIGLVANIRSQMQELLSVALRDSSKGPTTDRLIVVVEDLDRCSGETINNVLDATRIVAGQPNVVVILAADYEILLAAVAERFGADGRSEADAQTIARDYLAKLIQLPITLQPPSVEALSGYLYGLFEPRDAKQRLLGDALLSESVIAEPDESSSAGSKAEKTTPSGKEIEQKGGTDEVNTSTTKTQSGHIITKTSEEEAKPETVTLRDTVQEQELFSSLAKNYDFSNPRQLKRLRNTFMLLRQLLAADNRFVEVRELPADDDKKPEQVRFASYEEISRPALNMLFWLEYLNQLSAEERAKLPLDKAYSPDMPEWQQLRLPEGSELPEVKALMRGEEPDTSNENYLAWQQQVAAYVLPAVNAINVESKAVADSEPESAKEE